MLSKETVEIIEKYVDKTYFDIEKLKRYLELHSIVGNEVFGYCDKRKARGDRTTYSSWLDEEYGYKPLQIDVFVKRIPFYFYRPDIKNHKIGCLHSIITQFIGDKGDDKCLEEIYGCLEYLFYEKRLSLDSIFNYLHEQTNVRAEKYFFSWIDYLHLCERLTWDDPMPDRFINKYNEAREASGLKPIIYEVSYSAWGECFYRNGTVIEFEGIFPCDDEGNPIMKWIGLKVRNAAKLYATTKKSEEGKLYITITPKTSIHGLNVYNYEDEKEDYWYCLYEGPLNMSFDFTVLKMKRKKLNFTQQQVADAVGATVRTYQKWENGETTPDGHFLLRLLNWLDITDVQDCIHYSSVYEE